MQITRSKMIGLTVLTGLVAATAFAQHAKTGSVARATPKGDMSKYTMSDLKDKGKTPKPVRKGGAKSKGMAYGTFHADNRTDYNVNCWIDGVFIGGVSSYGDSYMDLPSGSHTFFGRSAGGSASWGPTSIYIPAYDTYTLRLND